MTNLPQMGKEFIVDTPIFIWSGNMLGLSLFSRALTLLPHFLRTRA